MEPTATFTYQDLDHGAQQIRLLTVSRHLTAGLINCTLSTFSVENTDPSYIALSYTWGSSPATKRILINGEIFLVGQNLYDFLQVARSKRLDDLLWIDQICINQNSTPEKNHQVKLMGSIYRDAMSVIVWLGAAADDSNWAMYTIATCERLHLNSAGQPFPSRNIEIKLKAADPTSEEPLDDGDVRWPSYPDKEPSWFIRHAIEHLFARAYWTRLWIVQELRLAQAAGFYCGMQEVAWPQVRNFVRRTMGLGLVPEHASTLILSNISDIGEYAETMSYNRRGYLPTLRSVNEHEYKSLPPMLRSVNEHDKMYPYTETAVQKLRHLVWLHCRAQCANPRDKVYGMLSLAALKREKLDKQLVLNVDYDRPIDDVFWHFFEQTLIDHVEAKVSLHYLPMVRWRHIWQPAWEDYAAKIMAKMGVQRTDLGQRIATIASRVIQEMEESGEAAGPPPSPPLQLVTTTVGGITASFWRPKRRPRDGRGVTPRDGNDYRHDEFCCETEDSLLCTRLVNLTEIRDPGPHQVVRILKVPRCTLGPRYK